jgi:hypothetical protein
VRMLVPILLFTALLPKVEAQRMAQAPHFPISASAAHRRPFLYPVPVFWDSLSPDREFRSERAATPPTVIVMQGPPRAEPADETVPPPAPLLIELQGDRYVRLSGEGSPGAEGFNEESAATQYHASKNSGPVREILPAVLVFRDGHREEVSDYTIADGILYARANYYTDGSWNRKVDLSSLNLPETFDANRSRGVRFQLPAAPNEVIVGP